MNLFRNFVDMVWKDVKPKDRERVLKQESKIAMRRMKEYSTEADKLALKNWKKYVSVWVERNDTMEGVVNEMQEDISIWYRLDLYDLMLEDAKLKFNLKTK